MEVTCEDTQYQTDHPTRKRSYPDYNAEENCEERNVKGASRRIVPLIKLLVPNYAVGAIIGKRGNNISEMKNKYGGKIRVSPSRECYPGTEERIVILSGEINEIIDLHEFIVDKIESEPSFEKNDRQLGNTPRSQQVKIVLINSAAGLVIGRGGVAIKALQEETKAKVIISSRDETFVYGERILIISGNREQRLEAANKVINKIAADEENAANKYLVYNSRRPGKMMQEQNNGTAQSFDRFHGNSLNLSAGETIFRNLQQLSNNQKFISTLTQNPLSRVNSQLANIPRLAVGRNDQNNHNGIKTTVQIQMEIPEILIGPLIGPKGNILNDFIQFSGAKIQLTPKNDFISGDSCRLLSIHGDIDQTQVAYYLINQKVTQYRDEIRSLLERR